MFLFIILGFWKFNCFCPNLMTLGGACITLSNCSRQPKNPTRCSGGSTGLIARSRWNTATSETGHNFSFHLFFYFYLCYIFSPCHPWLKEKSILLPLIGAKIIYLAQGYYAMIRVLCVTDSRRLVNNSAWIPWGFVLLITSRVRYTEPPRKQLDQGCYAVAWVGVEPTSEWKFLVVFSSN